MARDGAPSDNLDDEIISDAGSEFSFLSSEISPATETIFLSFSGFNSLSSIESASVPLEDDLHSLDQFSSMSQDCEGASLCLTSKLVSAWSELQHPYRIQRDLLLNIIFLFQMFMYFQKSMEEAIKRLKLEQKQMKDVYHLAWKEALAAKHKVLN